MAPWQKLVGERKGLYGKIGSQRVGGPNWLFYNNPHEDSPECPVGPTLCLLRNASPMTSCPVPLLKGPRLSRYRPTLQQMSQTIGTRGPWISLHTNGPTAVFAQPQSWCGVGTRLAAWPQLLPQHPSCEVADQPRVVLYESIVSAGIPPTVTPVSSQQQPTSSQSAIRSPFYCMHADCSASTPGCSVSATVTDFLLGELPLPPPPLPLLPTPPPSYTTITTTTTIITTTTTYHHYQHHHQLPLSSGRDFGG